MSKRSRKVAVDTAMPPQPDSLSFKALVFISHDTRDADLADAFSKLLHGATAGMLKSFRSSDKSGTQGLEYGSEWYSEIMRRIDEASDVVCLLTPRSLERPWILYEAGVAKGKLNTPVHGLVLGMPMSQVSGSGPFGQFQNCAGEARALAGLILQLAKRVPGCDPMEEIVESQVKLFLETAETLLAADPGKKPEGKKKPDEDIAAKLFEEIKVMFNELPSQIARRLNDNMGGGRSGRRRLSRAATQQLDYLLHGRFEPDAGWMMILGLLREPAPWLYEVGLEVRRAAALDDVSALEKAVEAFRHAFHVSMDGPLSEELGRDKRLIYAADELLGRLMDHHRVEHRKRRRVRLTKPE
jgi:hypothetical protein